jgi:hypothetical protein
MPTKNNETGHAKNVENFQQLMINCVGLGPRYNPTKEHLKLPELANKFNESQGTLHDVNTRLHPYTLAIDRREKVFVNLHKLATRIEGSVASSDASEATLKDLKTITRKIKGTRAIPKKKNTTTTNTQETDNNTNYISVSQMSYDSRIGHMDKLIQFLLTIGYNPNEQDLTIESINAIHDEMKASSTEVKTITVPLKNARINRNKSLYDPITGLVARAKTIKQYIKSVFGYNSPEYKAIHKIKFKQR